MTRRSKLDICLDVLKAAEEGVNKTNIVYQANLNFKVVDGYLAVLTEAGYIEHRDRQYFTTNRGSWFVAQYSDVVQTLKDALASGAEEQQE